MKTFLMVTGPKTDLWLVRTVAVLILTICLAPPKRSLYDRLGGEAGQFISVATGGPATYEGRQMTEVHKGLKISNSEFDASVGDLKATLDKIGVPITEQKELLAIVESTRQQIVEQR